jgi:hypothetical protein
MVYGHLGSFEWTWRAGVRPFAVSLYISGSVLVPIGGNAKRESVSGSRGAKEDSGRIAGREPRSTLQ